MSKQSSYAMPGGNVIGMFALVSVIGGANSVAVKFGFAELAPYWGAAVRSIVAAAILLAAAVYFKLPMPKGRDFSGVAIYGTLNIALAYAFGYYALTQVSAGMTQMSLSLVPLMVVFLAALEGVEKLQRQTLFGAGIAIVGTGIVFFDGFQMAASGAILALLASAFCIAQAAVVVKRYPKQHPIVENGIAMVIGGVLLLALSLFVGEDWSLPTQRQTILSLGFLILFGTVLQFTMYVQLINASSASTASYTIILMPIITAVLGAYLLDEAITIRFLVGGLVMVAGVYLGAMQHKPEVRRPLCH